MSAWIEREATIASDYCGLRTDAALAQLFSEFSRAQLTQWLKAGWVTLNQQVTRPKDKVRGGEHVVLRVPVPEISARDEAEAIPLDVVFEDEHVLIINKPAGLVVHPGAGNAQHTLMNALLHHHTGAQQLPRAGIIHRLDKDTTGLLIVAKTLVAHTALVRQMQAREIQRGYQTLVYGHVIGGGRLETMYGRHPGNRLKMAVCKQGKEAITLFTVNTHYQWATLLDVKLLTGRTHQIRVHMAHMKHPVVGDPLYGGRVRVPAGATESLRNVLQQFNRQALHACELCFVHPVTHVPLTFKAQLPADFQCLLTVLEHELA